jgi:hypothetical protein
VAEQDLIIVKWQFQRLHLHTPLLHGNGIKPTSRTTPKYRTPFGEGDQTRPSASAAASSMS